MGLHAIGEGDRAGFAQQAELGEFLAAAALGQRAVGQDRQAAGCLALAAQPLHQRRVVDCWLRVGQCGQGRDAARRGGDGGRGNRFPVFEAGLAERRRAYRPGRGRGSQLPPSIRTAPSGRPSEAPKSAISPSRTSRSPTRSTPEPTMRTPENSVSGFIPAVPLRQRCPAPPCARRPPSRPAP